MNASVFTPRRRILHILLASSALIQGASLHAAWTGAAADNSYFNVNNWSGGTIDGTFNSLAATTSINVGTTLGTFDLTSGLTISYTQNFALTLLSTSGATWNVGNISADFHSTFGTASLGAASRALTLDLGGVQRTFAINPTLAGNNTATLDTLNVYGNLSNGSLRKTGGGTLTLFNTNTLAGDVQVAGGVLRLSNSGTALGSFSALNKLQVLGNSNTDFGRAILNSTAANQLNDNAAVVLNNGFFGLQAAQNTSDTSETVGVLSIQGGRSAIAVVSGSNTMVDSMNATLTFASITRDAYSSIAIGSNTLGIGNGKSFIKVTNDASILADLKGAGGAAGSTTLSIVPWISSNGTNSLINGTPTSATFTSGTTSGFGLVTYTTAGGFRSLTDAEYVADITAATVNDNVRLTAATTLTANRTINALYSTGGINLGGFTLVLNSGALVTTGSLDNGVFDFGAGVGYIMPSRASITIGAAATVKAGAGFVFAGGTETPITLSGTVNAGTGPVVVNSGIVRLNGNDRLATTSALRVDRSATLNVFGAFSQTLASISGQGNIDMGNAAANIKVGTSFANSVTGSQVLVGGGGSISPGDSSGDLRASKLTFGTGVTSLRFEAGSSLTLDLSASGFDSIALTGGAAIIDGGTLYINRLAGFVPTDGQTFTSIVGTTAASGAGFTSIVDQSGSGFTYSFAIDGNNWVLTATASTVPEPSTYALFGGAGALFGACWFRRGNRRA